MGSIILSKQNRVLGSELLYFFSPFPCLHPFSSSSRFADAVDSCGATNNQLLFSRATTCGLHGICNRRCWLRKQDSGSSPRCSAHNHFFFSFPPRLTHPCSDVYSVAVWSGWLLISLFWSFFFFLRQRIQRWSGRTRLKTSSSGQEGQFCCCWFFFTPKYSQSTKMFGLHLQTGSQHDGGVCV